MTTAYMRKTEIKKLTIEDLYSCVEREQLNPLPALRWDVGTLALCERYYHKYVLPGTGQSLPDTLFVDLPKWIFLEYLAKVGDIVLRGSNDPALILLESIHPNMPGALPSQNIVGWDLPHIYAHSSSLCAMFFAILDRRRLSSLSAIPLASTLYIPAEDTNDRGCEAFYFGVDYRALYSAPWQSGTVYLFSSTHFVPQYRNIIWFSDQPVRPLAKMRVAPWEFPLLDQVNGLNWQESYRRSCNIPPRLPRQEDPQIHPLHAYRPLMEQACDYLDTHYAENVSLSSLSIRLDISPFKTLRLFRAIVGLSPLQYQTMLRITHAKQLLRRGRSIAETALETGFVDQSHLTFHFKRNLGVTPGNYLHLQ